MLGNEETRASSATPEEIKAQEPKDLVCQELPRERKRWIRPPLIGQASVTEHSIPGQHSETNKNAVTLTVTDSSYKSLPEYSNSWSDIQTFSFQHCVQPEIGLTPMSCQSLSFPLDTRMATNNSASTHIIGHQRHGALTIIENPSILHSESKITKENKSDLVSFTSLQDSGGIIEEVPVTIPESPNARAPSPASVSSVTSSRRLEWDSGADVGYLTHYISDQISISGHDMSTIEKIALAQGCSAALSMRLDPEGTICPGQQPSMLLSNKMKKHKNIHQIENSKTLSATDPTKIKDNANSVKIIADSENERAPNLLISNDSKHDLANLSTEENSMLLKNSGKNSKFVSAPKEQQNENGMQMKKLSSSLSSLNELEFQNLNSDILHRSQSQNSISKECVNPKHGRNYYPQKSSCVITNSLSSSSLATVVSKQDYRKTSNKHTQTSPSTFIKQSVAVQVHDDKHNIEQKFLEKDNKSLQNKHSYFENGGSTDHSEMILENTFDTEISIDATRVARNKHASAKAMVSEQLKNAFQKQTVHSSCQEPVHSSESQNSSESEAFVLHRDVSNVKSSQTNTVSSKHVQPNIEEIQNPSCNADNNLQANSSWFLNDGTFVEKHNFNDTSQRGSMDAIESAQSFEYLPAHAFENMTKETSKKHVMKEVSSSVTVQQDSLGVTSSESSASNTFSKDLDRIVTQMTNYLSGRPHSKSEKKKLVQKIVKRLLETKYMDDSTSRESHDPTKHKTHASLHNRVTGKRSNEAVSIKRSDSDSKLPQKAIQYADSKQQLHIHQTCAQLSDKCIGTAFSEENILLSSTSHSPVLEAPVSSNSGGTDNSTCPISTTTSTSCRSNTINWKRRSVQLQKKYELCKENQKQSQSQSALLNFCKTERENQLSWICTEIRHLKRLKQLLEDQERLLETMEKKTKFQGAKDKHIKSIHSSLTNASSTETSSAKSKRFVENSNTTSTEQDNSSIEKRNAVLNNIYKSHEKYKFFDFSTANTHSKHNGEEKYDVNSTGLVNMYKIQGKIPISEEKQFEKANMCLQKEIERLREEINTKMSKDEGVQTSLRSSSSSSFKTYVMSQRSESYSSSGRINMYIQAKDKTSSSDKLKDYKTSEGSETHEFNSKVPLCCCECKKLCEEVKRKLTETKKSDRVKQNRCRCSQVVSRELSGDKLSSYGTLNDATELTKDSECNVQINSLKETRVPKKAENAGVQTTLSFNEGFVGGSDYSNPQKNKQTHSENDNRETNCLCHKLIKNELIRDLESQAQTQHLDQKSAIQQESLKDEKTLSLDADGKQNHHKTKEIKTNGHSSKKCTICSASISGSSRSKHTRGNLLCNSCYQKTPVSSTRGSLEVLNKEPIAYILTLESTSEVSIPEQTGRKKLKEIVMKVPVKNRTQTNASGNKKQVKQKKIASMPKENRRPKHKVQCDNSETSDTANGVESLTLQEYLMINRPDFIESAEQRRSCLDDLAHMRELRQKSKKERLAMAAHVNSTAMKDLPRPPLAIKRLFSQRTMRVQTEQKYCKLPEMQVKKAERKKKEEFRTNQLMAQIFAKKLQRKALRGEVSLSNSRSVISSL